VSDHFNYSKQTPLPQPQQSEMASTSPAIKISRTKRLLSPSPSLSPTKRVKTEPSHDVPAQDDCAVNSSSLEGCDPSTWPATKTSDWSHRILQWIIQRKRDKTIERDPAELRAQDQDQFIAAGIRQTKEECDLQQYNGPRQTYVSQLKSPSPSPSPSASNIKPSSPYTSRAITLPSALYNWNNSPRPPPSAPRLGTLSSLDGVTPPSLFSPQSSPLFGPVEDGVVDHQTECELFEESTDL
jgi:hypothetical protein